MLDSSKATKKSGTPTRVIKGKYDIFSELLHKNFNNILESGYLPEQVKCADAMSIHEKVPRTDKETKLSVSSLAYP